MPTKLTHGRLRLLCLAVAAAGILACGAIYWRSSFPGSRFMQDDEASTTRAILDQVPLGSSVSTAVVLMTADGFECGAWDGGSRMGSQTPATVAGLNPYLLCWSKEKLVSLFLSKQWLVVFGVRDGVISTIKVTVGLTGL